jgi:xyloglucan-specific exo-beta-1,4-glucanase
MRGFAILSGLVALAASPLVEAVASQTYTWKNVKIGGGGGFVPSIVFSTKQKGCVRFLSGLHLQSDAQLKISVAYARTDIGGLYKLNSDDTWTPLLDFADNDRWNYWGVDALALDPTDATKIYSM